MIGRFTALLVAAVAVVGLSGTTPAQAAWGTAGVGAGRQAAMTMPTGSAPTVTMTTAVVGLGLVRTYTVTWPRTELHAGMPVTAYRVTRTSTLGVAVLSGGTCSGVTVLGLGFPTYVPADVAALTHSCTDTSAVDLGVVRYAITPVYGNWVGTPSVWSAPVS